MRLGRKAAIQLQAGLALYLLICLVPAAQAEAVRIGVLAKRGEALCRAKWQPTAEYLTREVSGYEFEIVPLPFVDIHPAIESRRIDFLLTNSGMYVELEVTCGVNRIATMLNSRDGATYSRFAGVVFRRADRNDLKNFQDLRGQRFMAVHESSLGGWRMALREFRDQGIDPAHDFRELSFAGTHDSVVFAVRDGLVDAGTVRTEILSRMAEAGKIDRRDFVVFHEIESDHYHPFDHSTRFYAEWPMAQLPHVGTDLAREVAAALMRIPPDDEAARAAGIHGWTVPMNYQSVHDCLRELRLPPYDRYGQATPADVLRHFRFEILVILALIAVLGYSVVKVGRLNKALRLSRDGIENELAQRVKAQEALKRAHDELDDRVRDRTAELVRTNESLQREIAARARTREALLDSEIKYKALVEGTVDAIFSCNADGVVVSWNRGAREMLGYAAHEIVGRPSRILLPEDRQSEYEVVLERVQRYGYVDRYETSRRAKNGDIVPVEITITAMHNEVNEVTGYSSIVRNISERLEAEEERELLQSQLLHMQKMEAVGTLAGGIAHDFNNLLTIINGHADLAIDSVPADSPVGQDIAAILTAGEQAASLTRQLLAFSRKQVIEPKVMDLNRVIGEFDKMLRRLIGEDIAIDTVLGRSLPRIQADPGQIEQILVNLIVNARDALNTLPETSREKTIRIETRTAGAFVPGAPGLDSEIDGPYVMIAISDNGIGMDAEVREKIFEPFYTTKPTGEGTGLGMSTVYGIVQQNLGSIRIESEPMRGTRIEIYWPCSIENSTATHPDTEPLNELRGTECILVAEDEEAICRLAATALNHLGYEVHTASNGVEALELVLGHRIRPDLLLTDIVMPEMDGVELGRRMRDLMPGVPVLYTSGYPNRPFADQRDSEDKFHFLAKPYTTTDLARKIRELLDTAAAVESGVQDRVDSDCET